MRDELRDPWGWLVAGVTGGVGWAALAATMGPGAVVAGVAIAGTVLGTKVVIGSARHRAEVRGGHARDATPSGQVRARDRLPEPPPGSAQAILVRRARGAVDRLRRLTDSSADRWIADEIRRAVVEAADLLDSLAELAGRITLLESSIAAAAPESLAEEIRLVQNRLGRASDDDVRIELARALAALDSQADSIARLLRRRDALLAQLQASTVGLEGLATKGGELVALGPASADPAQVHGMLADLTGSLDAVRSGVDEARSVLRDL